MLGRSKERKISRIITKVLKWRKLYNGSNEPAINKEKYSLTEAASKIGFSKKSLDDYLLQLRRGRILKFDFNANKNERVGVLRAYIKDQLKDKEVNFEDDFEINDEAEEDEEEPLEEPPHRNKIKKII